MRRRQPLSAEAVDEMLRALSRMTLSQTAVAFFRQAGWRIDADGEKTAPRRQPIPR